MKRLSIKIQRENKEQPKLEQFLYILRTGKKSLKLTVLYTFGPAGAAGWLTSTTEK